MNTDARRERGGHVDLSVVIACYNAEETLPQQLDALAAQVGSVPFEVLVCDNNSTDRSAEVARGYADRLDIRVVDASGIKGPAHARNRGVAEARAERIAFCDADDEVALDWVEEAYRALETHEFVAGKVDLTKLNSARVARTREMQQQDGLQESGTGVRLKHAGAGNMAFLRDRFEAVGGFDVGLRCLQDSDLCWRMQLAGTRLEYVPELVIHTRLRSTLRSMVRQAYLYGRSFAQLEDRYGLAAAETSDDIAPPQPRSVRETVERIRHLGDHGLGGAVWEVAWHVGHRVGRRGLEGAAHPAPSGVAA